LTFFESAVDGYERDRTGTATTAESGVFQRVW
jgi:hypothetical protein